MSNVALLIEPAGGTIGAPVRLLNQAMLVSERPQL